MLMHKEKKDPKLHFFQRKSQKDLNDSKNNIPWVTLKMQYSWICRKPTMEILRGLFSPKESHFLSNKTA